MSKEVKLPKAPVKLRLALLAHAQRLGLPDAIGKPREMGRKYFLSDEGRAGMRRTTQCPNEHPYVEGSYWERLDGKRVCKICHRERMDARRRVVGRPKQKRCQRGHILAKNQYKNGACKTCTKQREFVRPRRQRA